MNDMATLATFFGWCSVINIGLLLFSFFWITVLRGTSKRIHSAMMKVPEDELDLVYFKFIAQYKLLVLIFNITPYFALKIML